MNAPIDTRQTKICDKCEIPKPDTNEFFESRHDVGYGALRRATCRECRRKVKRIQDRMRSRRVVPARSEPKYEPGPKPCNECSSLPWRVIGAACLSCGLEHAEEPPVELVLFRSNPRVL